MRAENARLRADIESVVQQLAKLNAVPVTAPTPVSPPVIVVASPPSVSQPQSHWSHESSDSGFGGFGESSELKEQQANAQSSPFDNFGEAQPSADFHSFEVDAGFDSFAASPADPPGDGFAAFKSEGFESFSGASDGFAAFESTPGPATNTGQMSAFDAFDF